MARPSQDEGPSKDEGPSQDESPSQDQGPSEDEGPMCSRRLHLVSIPDSGRGWLVSPLRVRNDRDAAKGLTWCRYRILIEGGRFPPSGFDMTEMLQKASPQTLLKHYSVNSVF